MRFGFVGLLPLFLSACQVSEIAGEDGQDDDALSAAAAIVEGTPQARGVLRVANELSAGDLQHEVGLTSRAARNIFAHRAGPDGAAGTADDDPFDTLRELDDVYYVGPVTFDQLLRYATAHGYVDDGGPRPSGPGPRVVALSAGELHTCALTDAGAVWCWGYNSSGQLGNGAKADSSVPVPVAGLAGVVQISAGGYHTCALDAAGAVWCSGHNAEGELGDGTKTDSSVPVPVRGLGAAAHVAAGMFYTCALTPSGSASCWGDMYPLHLGVAPVAVANLAGARALVAGENHACALDGAGRATCFGWDTYGELGDGKKESASAVPVAVAGLSGISDIAAGQSSATCAITAGGVASCFGNNASGQLGNGRTSNSTTPVRVATSLPLATVQIGLMHACGLGTGGTVLCWGDNYFGQLGNGAPGASLTPAAVTGLSGVQAIVSGDFHSCALTGAGKVFCWGDNRYGQLGIRKTGGQPTPAPVEWAP